MRWKQVKFDEKESKRVREWKQVKMAEWEIDAMQTVVIGAKFKGEEYAY